MAITALRRLLAKVRGFFGSQDQSADLAAEIAGHLDLLADRYIRQGMAPEDARRAARRQFGNTTLLQEEHHAMLTFPSLEAIGRALRFGTRQLRLSPAFTATAILSMALGIGLNAAVFTLLDQLVLRFLPVPEPERLVMIWSTGPHLGDNRGERVSSYPLCRDYQSQAVAFDSVFCRWSTAAAVTLGDSTEPVRAELVSGNYFQGLRVGPALGRVLTAADDRPESPHAIVVSHRYWLDRLGAGPDVVGRKILVNRLPMEIVGVAAPGFTGVDPAESPQIWLPVRLKPLLSVENGLEDRNYHFLQLFARLRPEYSIQSARASLEPLFHQILEHEVKHPQIAKNSPFDRGRFLKRSVRLERAANGYSDLRGRYSTALLVLMGMAGLILLIACSNLASLLMARAVARQKEIAVRVSVGASRAAVIGQLLTESMVLALAGLGLGLVLSVVAARTLLSMLPASGALLALRAEPDLRIVLFAVGLTSATVLLFGLVPSLQATRLDLFGTLKAVSGGVAGSARSASVRKALVAVQVALSFLLLVGAGLFAQTLINLKRTGTGIEQIENLAVFQLDPAKSGYTAPRVRKLYQDILAEVRSLPGVTAAATTWMPLFRGFAPSWSVRIEGHQAKDGEDMEVESNVVSPGYWRTMGVRLLEGRELNEHDRFEFTEDARYPGLAVVNRSFARRFFPGRSAVGRRLGIGEQKEKLGIEIVGVVEDALYAGPRQGTRPMMYLPLLQMNHPMSASIYVRTAGIAPASLFPALRRIVARNDPSLPVYEMQTLGGQLDQTLGTERLIASLSVVFGVLATVMAALGLYGVMAFVVARRTKEIGLRMALGAPRRSVSWLVLREVAVLLCAGLAVGLPVALSAGRYLSAQLFEVAPVDALTFGAAIMVLASVAAIAGWVPARSAGTIDPLIALRND